MKKARHQAGFLFAVKDSLTAYIMPPMSGMPPPAISFSSLGTSATMDAAIALAGTAVAVLLGSWFDVVVYGPLDTDASCLLAVVDADGHALDADVAPVAAGEGELATAAQACLETLDRIEADEAHG